MRIPRLRVGSGCDPCRGRETAVRLGCDRCVGERGAFLGVSGFGASGEEDERFGGTSPLADAVLGAVRDKLEAALADGSTADQDQR